MESQKGDVKKTPGLGVPRQGGKPKANSAMGKKKKLKDKQGGIERKTLKKRGEKCHEKKKSS